MFADPFLAVSTLKARPGDLARDPRTLGGIFENLCVRDFLVYTDAPGASLSHYHDASGLEVDIIIEYGNQWAAMEIKLGAHRIEEGVRNLKRLCDKVTAKGAPPPTFMGVITAGGPVYTRDDGVFVVPIDCWKD